MSLSIGVQNTLNHIRFVFFFISNRDINVKENKDINFLPFMPDEYKKLWWPFSFGVF